MTKAQERVIDYIKNNWLEVVHGARHIDEFEIKKYEVKENEYFTSLVIESGLKGDEGTMARWFGRDRIHILVGKRGGIKYYDAKGTCKRGNIRLLFTIICDQKI